MSAKSVFTSVLDIAPMNIILYSPLRFMIYFHTDCNRMLPIPVNTLLSFIIRLEACCMTFMQE